MHFLKWDWSSFIIIIIAIINFYCGAVQNPQSLWGPNEGVEEM